MNAIIRKAGRSGAVVVGTLALGLSLAACGGNGDDEDTAESTTQEQTEDTSAEQPAEEETTADDSAAEDTTSEDTSSDDAASEDTASDSEDSDSQADGSATDTDITDKDLKAAKSRTMDIMKAFGEQDAEKVCGYALDPTTGEALDGASLDTCAKTIEDSGQLEQFTPELVDQIDESMLEATEEDGKVAISVGGTTAFTMVKGKDGEMYFSV